MLKAVASVWSKESENLDFRLALLHWEYNILVLIMHDQKH